VVTPPFALPDHLFWPGAYEQVRVRLAGIDAPEKGQPFGQRAKEAMSELVYGKPVRMECLKTDRYGRSVCNVWAAPPRPPTAPDARRRGGQVAAERVTSIVFRI
jgi:endonuclease YncB( thermonuclease family)